MTHTEYSLKADLYHKYRWEYPAVAIDAIMSGSRIDERSIVLDVGAGTGKLTKHFVGRAGTVYAVEPDANMLGVLTGHLDGVIALERYADRIPEIPDGSVDAIVAAHALHWCDAARTLPEFNRIAKDGCTIHSVENRNVSDDSLFKMTGGLIRKYADEGVKAKQDPDGIAAYFRDGRVTERSFRHSVGIDFETYLGSLASMSYLPSPGDASYRGFEADARALFDAYAERPVVVVEIITTVKCGVLSLSRN